MPVRKKHFKTEDSKRNPKNRFQQSLEALPEIPERQGRGKRTKAERLDRFGACVLKKVQCVS